MALINLPAARSHRSDHQSPHPPRSAAWRHVLLQRFGYDGRGSGW